MLTDMAIIVFNRCLIESKYSAKTFPCLEYLVEMFADKEGPHILSYWALVCPSKSLTDRFFAWLQPAKRLAKLCLSRF